MFSASADGDSVKRLYLKALSGQELTKAELAELKRNERAKEAKLRKQYYASIPQRDWARMSGRQPKVLKEQEVRYGLPVGGPVIDLNKLAPALHNFLAENAHKLARDDDPMMQGNGSPALERYREEKAIMAKLDRLERERQLLPLDDMRRILDHIAAIVKSAGEVLERQHGPAAAEILNEALDDMGRVMERALESDQEGISLDQPELPDSGAEPNSAE
jgi:hypothetical protein